MVRERVWHFSRRLELAPHHLPALFLIGPVCLTGCRQKPGQTIRIDGLSAGRTFDGIGSVSAGASSRLLIDYPEPYRSQVLDYLFRPDYGAALQDLKVEIGSDVNSTDGSEPSHMRSRGDENYNRGYEWWLMEEAKKRNPAIVLDSLAWGAPGWIGDGKYYSADMANYAAKFIEGGKQAHGLAIGYTGIWNEKEYDAGYVKLLHKTLRDHGLSTQIVCCDLYPEEHQWTMVDGIDKDPAFAAAVDVLGVHYPRDKRTWAMTTPASAEKLGKRLWSSEDGPWRGDWQGAETLAKIYNHNYIDSRMTEAETWSPVTSYYDVLSLPGSGLMRANTPWSGYYEVRPAIWVTAHTTQFAQPGWRYIDSACGYLAEKGSYVTLRSSSSSDYSVIVETIDAKAPQSVTVKITGGLSQAMVHAWRTNRSDFFDHLGDITPEKGVFSLSLDPNSIYSLTTTTGQQKGTTFPPASKTFPFPYHQNFDNVPSGQSPPFWSDQDGTFEAAPCKGRAGRCLQQAIAKMPIPWGATPDPFSLFGNVEWKDYQVSTDALLTGPGEVALFGRIESSDAFLDGKAKWPSAYVLDVREDGHWDLDSAKYKTPTRTLASGLAPFAAGHWHSLHLRFHGSEIEALIDGKAVAKVSDTAHQAGMAGVGSGWNSAQFDDVDVHE